MKIFILIGFCFLFCSPVHGVSCGYSLSVDGVSVSLVDDEDLSYTLSATVQKTNSSNQCKDAILTFGKGQNSSNFDRQLKGGNSYIPYVLSDIRSGKSTLKDFPDATSSDVIKVKFKGNSNEESIQFYFIVDLSHYSSSIDSGSFSDSVNVSLYRGSFGEESVADTFATIPIYLSYPEQTSISLVDTGAPYDENSTFKTLDFGYFEEGDSKTVDLVVKSNTYYRIQVSSEHGGRLKSFSKNPGRVWIGYDFYVEGSFRNIKNSMNNPVDIYSSSSGTNQNGKRLNLRFRIRDIAKARAGYYQDILTFTIVAN